MLGNFPDASLAQETHQPWKLTDKHFTDFITLSVCAHKIMEATDSESKLGDFPGDL